MDDKTATAQQETSSDTLDTQEQADTHIVTAEKAEEQAEENASGPFGWLPKLFKNK